MPKITIRDILDLGINANWFLKDADAEVIGSDGLNYYCILPQVAAANKACCRSGLYYTGCKVRL